MTTENEELIQENDEFGTNEFEAAFDEATGVEAPEEVEEPQEQAEETEESPEPQEDDLAARIAELERDRNDWRHKYQSDEGRVKAYQQQVNDLQQQLQSTPKEQIQEAFKSGSWDALQEDFPEIAQALEDRLKHEAKNLQQQVVNQAVGRFEKRLEPIEQQRQHDYIRDQYAALEAAHPNWREESSSVDFKNWLQLQPQPVKQLYQSNAATDAAYLLDSFKAMTGRNKAPEPSQIQQKRNADLARSVSVPGKRTQKREIPDDDYDAAWEAATANT